MLTGLTAVTVPNIRGYRVATCSPKANIMIYAEYFSIKKKGGEAAQSIRVSV